MNQFFSKPFGQSWKTTLVSYLLAVMLAVQPLLELEVNFSKGYEVLKYSLKLLFAAGIAFFGKYAADNSQVKALSKKIKD